MCHPQTHTRPMEAPATRFQREVDPEDEGREVTLNENLATVKKT